MSKLITRRLIKSQLHNIGLTGKFHTGRFSKSFKPILFSSQRGVSSW